MAGLRRAGVSRMSFKLRFDERALLLAVLSQLPPFIGYPRTLNGCAF